jgi:hypothetical protein
MSNHKSTQQMDADVPEGWVRLGRLALLRHIEEFPASLAKADKHGCLPLHELLENESSSIDDALLIIEKYPAALQHRNNKGYLPLHVECKHRCRSSIMSICMELYPEGLAIANEDGCLPLHRLLWNPASTIEDALMMIEKEPRALRHEGKEDRLPIHIECIYRRRSLIITKCIELYPEALGKADVQGYLPLHRIVSQRSSTLSVDVILMMIEKYPAALVRQNSYEFTPFHIECMTQCRSAIISKCIELYPQALDDTAITIIIEKTRGIQDYSFTKVFSIIFAIRPMSLYDYDDVTENDIRKNPYHRRRIMHLLPRQVFTPTHDADYRDLNWQPRAAIMILLSQIAKAEHLRS